MKKFPFPIVVSSAKIMCLNDQALCTFVQGVPFAQYWSKL